jgi:hypothetical protein
MTSAVVTTGGNYIWRFDYNGLQLGTTTSPAATHGQIPLVAHPSTGLISTNIAILQVSLPIRTSIGGANLGNITVRFYRLGPVVILRIDEFTSAACAGESLITDVFSGDFVPNFASQRYVVQVFNNNAIVPGFLRVSGFLFFDTVDMVTGQEAGFLNGASGGPCATSVSYLAL